MHAGEAGQVGEEDIALATRAAWLYHAGGLTQSEVAGRMGVTNAKAHRLIGRATRAGLVRVFVEGSIGNCIVHEAALSQRYGLQFCRVVPPLHDDGLPLRALGIAAAAFLRDRLESGEYRIIGVGHGRTLAAAVDHVPRIDAAGLRLVSLLGGLPRRNYANPFEVIDRLAEKTGSDAYLLPVPMFAASPADRDVLRRQTGVSEAVALARQAGLIILGIGEATSEAFLSRAGVFSRDDLRLLHAAGAAGEALGYFYSRDGKLVDTQLHDRVTGLSLEAFAQAGGPCQIVAVAGGAGKENAIQAVLQSRLLTGLITDELTARRLVASNI